MRRGKKYIKNTTRLENDGITGECDIYDPKECLIIDTKCSWDIGTHPFFIEEAQKREKKQDISIKCKVICGYLIVTKLI